MSECPEELLYSKSHEWVRDDGGNTVTVGITDHAQSLMGDLVFVELPELNRTVNVGEDIAVVESVKTASDVYAPLSGEVIEINRQLSSSPETVNHDPYGKGWLFRLKITDSSALAEMLDAKSYSTLIEE